MRNRRKWNQEKSAWMLLLLGSVTIFMGYFSWGIFTISYKATSYKTIGFAFTILTLLLYLGMTYACVRNKEMTALTTQILGVSFVGGFVDLIFLVTNSIRLFQQKEYIFLIIGILCFLIFTVCIVYILCTRKNKRRNICIITYVKERRWLYLLLMLTGIFMFDSDAMQFRWDGLLYYITCEDLDISSLSSLAIYGHVAQTYGMLIGLGNLIVGNTKVVMVGLNVLLALISICAFYGILKAVIPGKQEWKYALGTAFYAWSPFLLGMVHYHNLDFYCQCFFPLVLYFLYQKKWVYFSVSSFLFCFTKEPAIVIYGIMCAGVVIRDYINDMDNSWIKKMKKLLMRKQYYLMILTGVLWLITYRILGPWSAGDGAFSIDIIYVLNKLKNLYVLNFNWIFSLLAICGLFILIKKKEWRIFEILLPVWCSQIVFTAFSCLFKTVNHPRYNDTNQVTLYLLAIVPILYCFEQAVIWGVGVFMAIIILLSSFYTLDPVTRAFYPHYNIGTRTMIYTAGAPLGDGMIYNRQMLGLEKVINMALQDALSISDTVFFQTINNNAYYFDGMAEVGEDNKKARVDLEYWNPVIGEREELADDKTKEFQVYQLTDSVNWDDLERDLNGKINYIYLSTYSESYMDKIKKNYTILEEEEYQYKGWKLKRVCFEMD